MEPQIRSAKDFRVSLQQRIKNFANENDQDIQEVMKKVAFDRFLSRICSSDESQWILKGGYALELLLDQSRTTKDIDLVLRNHEKQSLSANEVESSIKNTLVQGLQKDLGDGFQFILRGQDHSLDNTPYGGRRYGIECQIAGRRFVSFHIDISVNDISRKPFLEQLEGEDWVGFAGIAPPKLWALAPEEIFSEKLHAYTMPRSQENSRVRDIVDMYLLIAKQKLNPDRLKECIQNVFRRRKTHNIPDDFHNPPESWGPRCLQIAQKCGVNKDIDEIFHTIHGYLRENKILSPMTSHPQQAHRKEGLNQPMPQKVQNSGINVRM